MERISRFRAIVLLAFFCLIVGLYGIKLFNLQVVESEGKSQNMTVYQTKNRVKASRGDILDRNGNVLVGNRASYDLAFNHFVIKSADGTNQYLFDLINKAKELELTYIDHFPVTASRPFEYTHDQFTAVWTKYFQKYLRDREMDSDITAPLLVQKLRERYKIPAEWTDEQARAVIGLRYEFDLRGVANIPNYIFIEDISDKNLSAILELNVPGLMVESSTVREYHTSFAAHIIGTMGAITPEQWPEYKEKGYAMDAVIGQSGFEAAFEEYLHGVDGTRVDKVAKDGTIISQEYVKGKEPKAGNNVETTLDMNLQIVTEEALAKTMAELRDPEKNKGAGTDAQGAAAVVMTTKGEVLAMASYPTYDLMTYNEKFEELSKAEFAPMFNRALHGAYPPGSTYKMCTLISAMNAGKYHATEEIEDLGVFTKYEGFAPKCLAYSSKGVTHGSIDCVTALAVSCNYFFYELGDRIKYIDTLDATAKALGLGEPTGIELSENPGHRSNAESMMEAQGRKFTIGDLIQTSIGQSENKFTPMQLAVYTATLAERGNRYSATFLNRVVAPDYSKLILENKPQLVSSMEISDEIYNSYVEGMKAAVTRGTAKALQGLSVTAAAKTGTAQHGLGKNKSDHGAFVCFAPAEKPEIVIALYGEQVGGGSAMGRVAKAILEYYFSADEISDVVAFENRLG